MCRHIYDWNIVNCDDKQTIQQQFIPTAQDRRRQTRSTTKSVRTTSPDGRQTRSTTVSVRSTEQDRRQTRSTTVSVRPTAQDCRQTRSTTVSVRPVAQDCRQTRSSTLSVCTRRQTRYSQWSIFLQYQQLWPCVLSNSRRTVVVNNHSLIDR